ncbi:hypothetical protein GCM10010124_36990 [Pilimelia terevasa]|uniref:Integrase catalytic domain-containing protein n=1 Tax=Pilimelia terevasa TaxID=53372 RepID=A0A8J3BQH3_9ACTN|nr:hypothetical protein GCM10010124_36990 [Pilimelia terevasa]
MGWLYLATVIDLASRRVVGWAVAEHLRTDLVDAALTDALTRRRPASGLVFHSDRGERRQERESVVDGQVRIEEHSHTGHRCRPHAGPQPTRDGRWQT